MIRVFSAVKISLLYTSARPHQVINVLSEWQCRASNWGRIEVVLVTDEPFTESFSNMRWYLNDGREDCVTGWNRAASEADGDLLVQVSDDLFPPENWDDLLESLLPAGKKISLQLPDERGLPDAVYHPVLTRQAYEHFGHLYPPSFRSMFCDNWFFYAHRQAGFLRQPQQDQFWNHRHRTTHDIEVDKVTEKHEAEGRYLEGQQTLVSELGKIGIKLVLE